MAGDSSPHNQCGHPDDPVAGWVCRHLLDVVAAQGSDSGGRQYIGSGLRFHVLCRDCRDAPPVDLSLSPDGQFAAVVPTRGRYGLVMDLVNGTVTMQLDRGDYHPDVSNFPCAFFRPSGDVLLVHATAWNRLDISDPSTGKLLTERGPTRYRRGEVRPDHYLDYFHGGLLVSPDQNWIADNGWVWHPVGVVTTWSLSQWMTENVWESEDGSTKHALCWRNYFWDGPMCWIDNTTLAVYGHGRDEETLVPAAVLYDVISGREIGGFAGPKGTFVFDEYLFDFSAETGTVVWDIETGERLLSQGSS